MCTTEDEVRSDECAQEPTPIEKLLDEEHTREALKRFSAYSGQDSLSGMFHFGAVSALAIATATLNSGYVPTVDEIVQNLESDCRRAFMVNMQCALGIEAQKIFDDFEKSLAADLKQDLDSALEN